MTLPLRHIGSLLKRLRLRSGLSQERLADRANVSVKTVSRLEAGRWTRPETLKKIAVTLGIDVAKLFDPREVARVAVGPDASEDHDRGPYQDDAEISVGDFIVRLDLDVAKSIIDLADALKKAIGDRVD